MSQRITKSAAAKFQADQLLEAITDYAIYMLDPDGTIVTWNAGAARTKGYTSSEIIGRNFGIFFTPEDRLSGKPAQMLAVARGEGRCEDEGWGVRKDCSRFWANAVIDPIRAADGRLVGYARITRDVTQRRAILEALRDSEQRFRRLTDSVVQYAIFGLDLNGIVTSWNPGAERITGYTKSMILGRHFGCFFTPDDQARGTPAVALARASKEGHFEEEAQRVREDGTSFWANAAIDPIHDADGNVIGFVEVVRDCTGARNAKAAHPKQNEAAPQTFTDSLHEYAVFTLDPAGHVTSWNADAQRTKGYTEGEILGKQYSCFFTAEEQQDGKPERLLAAARLQGRVADEGYRIRKDGTRFWANTVIASIPSQDGEIIGFAKITRDMTEAWRAQETLREHDDHVRMLVDNAVDYAFFSLDTAGFITNWNPSAERAMGYRSDEVIGQHYGLFFSDQDKLDGKPAHTLSCVRVRGRIEEEGWRVRKDGSRFWAHVVVDAVRDGNAEISGFATVTHDVTDRRALEQTREQLFQSQKMETIGQLTGGVAHDFNNLLSAVGISLELILLSNDQSKIQSFVTSAQQAAERGAKLTAQLLAFSRRQTLWPQTSCMNTLISVFETILRRVGGESITLEVILEPDLYLTDVDQAQFQSALLNLAVNARDAMPNGGALTIETHNILMTEATATMVGEIHPGAYAAVTVRDTGVGMTPEVRAKAIEPFFTTKDVGQGSGLGLSQIYGFARQSNGQLFIESTVGRGTSITLYLPQSCHATIETDEPPPAAIAHGRGTVLVVEDDPVVLDLACSAAKILGYNVHRAADGPAALEVLASSLPIDCLFTDIIMPRGLNGVQLAQEARKMRPELRVLLASGYPREALYERQGLSDTMDFIAKPYTLSALSQRLEALTHT
jgi:PAS domain S-box-containing protein